MIDFTKEGCYRNGDVEPWSTANILEAADSEVGPGCCDKSYQKLRDIMEASTDLLESLEDVLTILTDSVGDFDYDKALAAIAKARGEK